MNMASLMGCPMVALDTNQSTATTTSLLGGTEHISDLVLWLRSERFVSSRVAVSVAHEYGVLCIGGPMVVLDTRFKRLNNVMLVIICMRLP